MDMVRELFPDRSYDPQQFGQGQYKDYTFQCERFSDSLRELTPLHEEHWAETETHQDLPLKPDFDLMLECERSGGLLQFTSRHKGVLIGNMRVYIARSTHTQELFATEDTFYVTPEHRGGFMAVRLWQFVESSVRSIGVREIHFDSKLVNKADRMAVYLKYKPVAMKFTKTFN